MKPDDNSETILDAGYDKDETQQQRLITVLGELEDEVEKQNSLKHTFIRGALQGLGTVIGATVLLAILVSLIVMTVRSLGLENIPFVKDFVEKVIVEQLNRRND